MVNRSLKDSDHRPSPHGFLVVSDTASEAVGWTSRSQS
jgi:hypothetical protein